MPAQVLVHEFIFPLAGRRSLYPFALRLLFSLCFILGTSWVSPAPLAWAEEDQALVLGAFITLAKTYGYTRGAERGRRYLVQEYRAYPVLASQNAPNGERWRQIIFAEAQETLSGEGWVLEPSPSHTEHTRVFLRIPTLPNENLRVLSVPGADLSLLKERRENRLFPMLAWRRVEYRTTQELRLWVRDRMGILRLGQSVNMLQEAYASLRRENVPEERLRRLLAGVAYVGDGVRELRWALGPPLSILKGESSHQADPQAVDQFWEYPGMRMSIIQGRVSRIETVQ